MKHKIFSISIVATFLIVQYSGNIKVNADYYIDGDLTIEEGAVLYIPTESEEKLLREKNEAMLSVNQARSDPDNVYYVLNVTTFEQENGYYCAPATVKQVIHFINGTSLSQATYASKLGTTSAGTDMTKIPSVLNQYVGSSWTYAYDSIGSQSNWTNVITYNASVGMPVILDINTSGISAFPYTTTGHFVNTSGVNIRVLSSGTTSKIRITDPYTPGLGNIWYNTSTLYSANNNHSRKAFIH